MAIIQNGTRENEQVGIGTVSTIEEIVANKNLSNPAIIIIGEVVRHRARILEIAQKHELEVI